MWTGFSFCCCGSPFRAWGGLLVLVWVFARTGSRPCVVWSPSMATSYFLLLVQEKVTKENTPSDPRPRLRRGFATGERVRPTGHPWPVVRIGAIPRAARASRGWSVRPPPLLRGTQESKSQASAAGTAALCSSRAPLSRGKCTEEKPRSGGRQDAGHFDESTRMCSRRSPPCTCAVTRAGMPA